MQWSRTYNKKKCNFFHGMYRVSNVLAGTRSCCTFRPKVSRYKLTLNQQKSAEFTLTVVVVTTLKERGGARPLVGVGVVVCFLVCVA